MSLSVAGTWKSDRDEINSETRAQFNSRIVSSDNEQEKLIRVENETPTNMESLILAQDERWRRA